MASSFVKFRKSSFLLPVCMTLFGVFLFSQEADASSGVHKCSNKTLKCAVYVDGGDRGDVVHILDEHARFVAEGRILKKVVHKRRSLAIVKILRPGSMQKMIQKAFPVVLEAKSPCKYEDHYRHMRKIKKKHPNLVQKGIKIKTQKDKRFSALKKAKNRSSTLVVSSAYNY